MGRGEPISLNVVSYKIETEIITIKVLFAVPVVSCYMSCSEACFPSGLNSKSYDQRLRNILIFSAVTRK